jgi:hypothetical protein
MEYSIGQLKKYRSRFAWIFAISIVTLLVSRPFMSVDTERGNLPMSPPTQSQSISSPPKTEPNISLSMSLSIISLLTSVVSLVGLILTTGITWRKAQHDQQLAALDIEMKRLEIKKMKNKLESKNEKKTD